MALVSGFVAFALAILVILYALSLLATGLSMLPGGDLIVGGLAFAIGLLLGGTAFHTSAVGIVDIESYPHAVGSALLGSIAWGAFAWLPLFGPVLGLGAWLAVVDWRYPGDYVTTGLIAVTTWAIAFLLTWPLAFLGLDGVYAAGVPGV